MPEYRVEEMVGEVVVLSHDVDAATPKSAAVAATQRRIAFRTEQEEWIRVIDLASGSSFVFAYAGTDRRSLLDRQLLEAAKARRESADPKPTRKKTEP